MRRALAKVEARPPALAPDLVAETRRLASAARSKRTLEAYRADWQTFTAWCRARRLEPLPAAPEAVAAYIADRARTGAKPASIARYLASISVAHETAGHPSPRSATCVKEVWKGIRRTLGTAQRQVAPILPKQLRAMVGALPDSRLGARDRALLLLGFAGAFRRSELCSLDVADLAFTDDGLEIRLRHSKTDQEGQGRTVGVPYGSTRGTCPVRAARAWLDAAGLECGPLFRSVNRHGRVSATRLSPQTVARVVKRTARAAGLDAATVSGHSLRAGLATAAAKAGKPAHAIMQQTRHQSLGMVLRYVRATELWQDNAAAGLL